MDKHSIIKIFCIAILLLLLALVIEKKYPVTTLPMEYIINDDTEKSDVIASRAITIYVSDFNELIFPLTLEVSGTRSAYSNDIELTFSMLTEHSNYLPMGVKTIIPPSTRLEHYKIINGELILTVSKEFFNYNELELDHMIDILTYSFTEISGVNSLTIQCKDCEQEVTASETFKQLNRNSHVLNTVMEADHFSNSKTLTIFYYTAAGDDYYLVPVNMVVNKDHKSDETLIDEIFVSNHINIPVTSYINEENLNNTRDTLSNMKSGYTNTENDYSLIQYYLTLSTNTETLPRNELMDFNNYHVELR